MNQFILNQLVRDSIKYLQPYSSARDEFESDGSELVFLDANENPFPTDVNRYPDPQQRSLKAILSKIKKIDDKNILLGNGSDEILDLLFRAFCEPGRDNVITLPPTYGMYKVLANINNVENIEVLLKSNFQPDVKEVLAAVTPNTKLIFLCSPNNPTGNSFSTESVLEILKNFSGLVIIDEAYIDFSEEKSWLERLEEYPNLVITQTLSKAYGMAGIRLGICYASKEIIAVLNKIKPPYNVNQLTQSRAMDRLNDIKTVSSEIAEILKERTRLSKALLQVDIVEEVFQSDANFILIRVDDATKRYNELVEKGVVIRNRTTQPLCENTLRLTVGKSKENEKLIAALTELQPITNN